MSTSLPEQTRHLIRAVAILRIQPLPSRSLDEFIATYLTRERLCGGEYNTTCLRRTNAASDEYPERCRKCGVALSAFKIASDSPLILRGLLDSACHVQYLTDFCLQTMIDRCMALKPSHLLDPKWRYIDSPVFDRSPQKRPLGVRYQPQNSGPPTWVERERTRRAFWRVQLFFELKTAMTRSAPGWPSEDSNRLQCIISFWDENSFGLCQHTHVRTVVEFCEEIISAGAPCHAPLKSLSQLPRPMDLGPKYEPPAPQCWRSFELDDWSPGYDFLTGLFMQGASPMRYADFTVYRRLGIYVWEIERLVALELKNKPPTMIRSPTDVDLYRSNIWFTWESLLSKEELGERDRNRFNEFPEAAREFGSRKKESYWHIKLD